MTDKNVRIYASKDYFLQRLEDGFTEVAFAKSSERVPLKTSPDLVKFVAGMFVFYHPECKIDVYGWARIKRYVAKGTYINPRFCFRHPRIFCSTPEELEQLRDAYKLVFDKKESLAGIISDFWG